MKRDNHKLKFKTCSPIETVENILKKLDEIGIETDESWMDVSDIGTYSLRVSLKGSLIGANGKGMTKEYARASAYAEFCERLQNYKLIPNHTFCTLIVNNEFNYSFFPEEKRLSAAKLVEENSAFIQMVLKNRGVNEAPEKEKIEALQKLQKMDFNVYGVKDSFLCIPFYSIKNNKVQYIPYFMYNLHYGSNGMCAGNEMNEALVQGISEIYERLVHARISKEKPVLPDIPDEYVKKYPEVYEMYQAIRDMEGFDAYLKDCSFGGEYPVAGLVVVTKNTGKYGIKYGAHPDYGIAMERLFTEATQGVDIKKFATRSTFDFTNEGVGSNLNIMNGFKTSEANFPYQIFGDEPTYTFVEQEDVRTKTNKELREKWINKFIEDGYDVLIHDASFLGIPSYHILVPGLSEMNISDEMAFEAENARYHVKNLINNPKLIDKDNVKYLTSVLSYYSGSIAENRLKDHTGLFSSYPYIGSEAEADYIYMLSMCNAMMDRYDLAVFNMDIFLNVIAQRGGKTDMKYKLIREYFVGRLNHLSHEDVMTYFRKLYDAEYYEYIDELFRDVNQICIKQYPTIQYAAEDKNSAESTKMLRTFEEMIKKVKAYQEIHLVDQEALKCLCD